MGERYVDVGKVRSRSAPRPGAHGGHPEWISTRELRSRLSDVLVSVTDLEALEELGMVQDVAAYREAKKLAGEQPARARAARPARSSA